MPVCARLAPRGGHGKEEALFSGAVDKAWDVAWDVQAGQGKTLVVWNGTWVGSVEELAAGQGASACTLALGTPKW